LRRPGGCDSSANSSLPAAPVYYARPALRAARRAAYAPAAVA